MLFITEPPLWFVMKMEHTAYPNFDHEEGVGWTSIKMFLKASLVFWELVLNDGNVDWL